MWVSSKQGGPKGLEDFLKVRGWRTTNDTDVQAGHVLVSYLLSIFFILSTFDEEKMLVGADGPYSHTAIGVAEGLTDAHNVAHHLAPLSVYLGVNLIYVPPE